MESHAMATEDYLIEGLSFKLAPGASCDKSEKRYLLASRREQLFTKRCESHTYSSNW